VAEEHVFARNRVAGANRPSQTSPDDSSKTRSELIGELVRLRRRVAELENVLACDGARSGGTGPPDCGSADDESTSWYRSYERDRRLIAYEIHDGLVQDATGAQMYLETLLETRSVPPGPARNDIQTALELVRRAVSEGRRLISGLRPPILDEFGVVAAIEYLIKDQPADGPSIKLTVDVQFERLEPLWEAVIYRIAQEAITNVRRHSKSGRADIRLAQVKDRIELEIRDWGVGFDPAGIEGKRLGLQGIRERARLLRGRAVIDSAPGVGTRVFVDLPMAHAPEEAVIMNDRSVE